ncbi:UNVERIFIED_CONTAM: hypothetical protein HDU68_007156 [Siphonaria sp. JEL0065]|nr:hypothetical protein HDU68_007156 [Siphonaria sp. JEL0065]
MKKVNITIGLVAEYCYMEGLRYGDAGSRVVNYGLDYFSPDQIRANFSLNYRSDMGSYYTDLSRLAAIELINNSPDILPGVHVNVKRFSECGEFVPGILEDDYSRMTGYASAILGPDIIENNQDVIGVSGFMYSSTAKGVFEELSIHQIPTCGVGPTSPRFADRNKYSYVMLLSPTMGWGDDMSMNYAYDIRKSMNSHGVTIVQDLGVSDYSPDTIETLCTTLKRSNVRYFVISALIIDHLYAGLGGCGLVSPDYITISYFFICTFSFS